MRRVLGFLFALSLLSAQAETIVFYDFADGEAGADVTCVSNRADDGATFNGTASVADGGAVKYSDDVPGMALYADCDAMTPLVSNWKSIEFSVTGGKGAVISVPGLGSRLCELGMEGDFTLEFFAKYEEAQNWTDFLKFYFQDASDNNRQAKYVVWGNNFGLQNTAANPTTFGAAVDRWYHLAAVYTAADGNWRMYSNGILFATQQNKILGAGSTTALTLGGESASYEAFAGKLAALRISSGALAPSQFMKVVNGEPPVLPGAIAFYPFDEAAPGAQVEKVDNAMDALRHAGSAKSVNGGAMPVYSADVPGYWLYSDDTYTNLLSSTANSVQFARAEGVDNSGGLITLSQLSTAMSLYDEGTVEFFAKSDAHLTWRNMVTFNAGQRFKICYDGSNLQYQNFWTYNLPDSCLPAAAPADSGKWLHAAITWTKRDNRAQCYLDYVNKGSVFLTNVTQTASNPFYVGGSGSASESFCGKVYGLRVSSCVLKPSQMLHVTQFPMHGDGVLVSRDGVNVLKATTIIIEEGKRLKIRSGVALTADLVNYGGAAVAAGLYTGEAGAEGATVVEWIEGAGTLAVTGVSDTSIWMTPGNGNWSEARNWSKEQLPQAGRPAAINVQMPTSYRVTVDTPVSAPSQLSIANSSVETATMDIAPGGSMSLADAQVQVSRGGVLEVSGGDFFATNTTLTAEAGGTVRVTSGHFRLVDNAADAVKFREGSLLELTGGATEIIHGTKNENVFSLATGSRLKVSGDATLDLRGVFNKNCYLRGSEVLFCDRSKVTVSHCSIGAMSGAQTFALRDQASMTFKDDAVLTFGAGVPGPIEANFDSRAQTVVPYGIIVGATGSAGVTLNIRNGHHLLGKGNWNAIGSSYNSATRGTVNVYHGAFVQRSAAQYTDCPYGITVGENKNKSTSGAVGVLNVYADGVVSNLTAGTTKGQGVYLRVGSGPYGDGTINQYGGEIYHNSNLGCLIGAWGGTGRWNVCSGGVATVLCDVYVGGAETNNLVAFGPGTRPDNGFGNGGPKFAAAYPVDALSTGTLNVEDGTFTTTSNLVVSALGTGTVRMGPKASRIEAKDVTLNGGSTVVFRFAPESTGTIAASGKLTVAEGTKLVLDFTDYVRGKRASFPLFTFAEREGDFTDVEIVGEEPMDGRLKKEGNRYRYVVPHGYTLMLR